MATINETSKKIREFEGIIEGILRSAIFNKPLSEVIISSYNDRVVKTEKFQKMPLWAREKIITFWRCSLKNMTDEFTFLMWVGIDGKLHNRKWDELNEEEKEHFRQGNRKSVFVWLELDEKITSEGVVVKTYTPTDKVYFKPNS